MPEKQRCLSTRYKVITSVPRVWIDGEWVKTKGTTLGADNGLGIAAIMAVMEDKTLKHGPIEALCTADEETGMYGANDLPANQMTADILLNLDTEDEGEMIVRTPTPLMSKRISSSRILRISGLWWCF